MVFQLIQKIKERTQVSNAFVLLLYLLNAAIVMNFHKFIFSYFLISIFFIFNSVFALLNQKFYRILFFNLSLASILLVINFPRIGNHSTFLMVSIVVTLFLFLRKVLFNNSLNKEILPYIFRLFLVIVYFYAGFHKLNYDFLNPCVSCVNGINEFNISNFTFSEYKMTPIVSSIIQYATLVLEMVLPFGLLFYKTRKTTVMLLFGFHFYLIFAGFADFAAVVLFLITGSVLLFQNEKFNLKWVQIYYVFLILSIFVRYFLFKKGILLNKHVFIQGIIFGIGWLYFVINYYLKLKIIPSIYNKKFTPYLAVMFIIISFWTLKTYIGLGNQGNLTMFSNLATDSKKQNHILLNTNALRVFDYENDCVYFIDFINPDNKDDTFTGYYLPMVEFQYYIKHWQKKHSKPIACTLKYQNKIYKIEDLVQSKFNQGKWWYKYLSFRRIQESGPNECRW